MDTVALYLPLDARDLVRFRAKCVVNMETGCWEWTAYVDPNGYGRLSVARYQRADALAHRAAWWLYRGSIPPDRPELDHLCKVPCCVNPDHLEPVTREENIRRSESESVLNSRKTHCPAGHPYVGRRCPTCERDGYRTVRRPRYRARLRDRRAALIGEWGTRIGDVLYRVSDGCAVTVTRVNLRTLTGEGCSRRECAYGT